MLKTTLNLLSSANACESGMRTLTSALGDWNADKEIDLSFILESNGLDHAIWAMQATTVDCKQQIVYMAMEFSTACLDNFEKVYPDDKRPRLAIEAAENFINKTITYEQLLAAESAARSAWSAAWSAESAWSAWSAAWSAESAAAKQRNKEIFLKHIS